MLQYGQYRVICENKGMQLLIALFELQSSNKKLVNLPDEQIEWLVELDERQQKICS